MHDCTVSCFWSRENWTSKVWSLIRETLYVNSQKCELYVLRQAVCRLANVCLYIVFIIYLLNVHSNRPEPGCSRIISTNLTEPWNSQKEIRSLNEQKCAKLIRGWDHFLR